MCLLLEMSRLCSSVRLQAAQRSQPRPHLVEGGGGSFVRGAMRRG